MHPFENCSAHQGLSPSWHSNHLVSQGQRCMFEWEGVLVGGSRDGTPEPRKPDTSHY